MSKFPNSYLYNQNGIYKIVLNFEDNNNNNNINENKNNENKNNNNNLNNEKKN